GLPASGINRTNLLNMNICGHRTTSWAAHHVRQAAARGGRGTAPSDAYRDADLSTAARADPDVLHEDHLGRSWPCVPSTVAAGSRRGRGSPRTDLRVRRCGARRLTRRRPHDRDRWPASIGATDCGPQVSPGY